MTSKQKLIVFISHISEERNLALFIKSEIEAAFLGMVDLFVSTDEGESLPLGQRWLDKISKALR
jgi:hypothetical protein